MADKDPTATQHFVYIEAMKYAPLENIINGSSVPGSLQTLEVTSPVNGELLSSIPLSTAAEVDVSVDAAASAFPEWAALTLRQRCDIFYRYRQLLQENLDELARVCHEENGKTINESKAEVLKAIELTELACSQPYHVLLAAHSCHRHRLYCALLCHCQEAALWLTHAAT